MDVELRTLATPRASWSSTCSTKAFTHARARTHAWPLYTHTHVRLSPCLQGKKVPMDVELRTLATPAGELELDLLYKGVDGAGDEGCSCCGMHWYVLWTGT